MTIRLATFNAENLFARYKFRKGIDPLKKDGFSINDVAFDIFDETEKKLTALAIKEVKADIIALQETESLPVLDTFNSAYLAGRYKYRMLIDGNDPRQIDVALLSKYPIVRLRSHREERTATNKATLFSRDCLEAVIDVDGKLLYLYINHFKSMMEGREQTAARRKEQANRVAALIDEQWKTRRYKGNFVVLGDFNDYPEGNTSLSALLAHKGLVNVVTRLPADEQWTHYYTGGNEYRQLDYLLLSKSLAAKNANLPGIMRKGLPLRATRYTGKRFDGVGQNSPKASDHAPVYIDLELD